MAYQVFISYSSKDKKMADAVCHYLEQERIRCWIAPRDVRLGTNFAEEIVNAIPICKVMVMIFSVNSNSSKQVMRELELALNYDLIVIPVRIEDILPTGGMSFYLSTMQWIDIIDTKTDHNLSLLVNRIRNILGVVQERDVKPENRQMPEKTEKPKEIRNTLYKKNNIKQKKRSNANVKKRIAILSTAVLTIAIGLTVFFMRDTLFERKSTDFSLASGESSPVPSKEPVTPILRETPGPASRPEDFGWDGNMVIAFEDESMESLVIKTIKKKGQNIGDEVWAADIFGLDVLIQLNFGSDPEIEESMGDFLNLESDKDLYNKEELAEYAVADSNVIYSLEGLQYAKNLKYLALTNHDIEDLTPIAGLDGLELLYFSSGEELISNIKDISPIGNLTGLMHLHLINCSVSDISSIKNLTNLRHIMLRNTAVSDIGALENMTSLHDLLLENNKITDLNALASLDCVFHLRVDNNQLNDLSYLTDSALIKNCGILGLVNTGISDLSFLSSAGNLEYLEINGNEIEDLSPLLNCGLRELHLDTDTYNKNLDTISELVNKGCKVLTSDSLEG